MKFEKKLFLEGLVLGAVIFVFCLILLALFNEASVPWYTNSQWWVAFGTIGLGIAAVFQEAIRRAFSKTELLVDIKQEPPDCHLIEMRYEDGSSAGYVYYIRLNVKNIGNTEARNVEIYINKCEQIFSDGSEEIVKTFLPMNLRWSHYQSTSMDILPGHKRHGDLGFLKNWNGNNIMLFSTVVQPNMVGGNVIPNVLKPGRYYIELLIGAENVTAFLQKYELIFEEGVFTGYDSIDESKVQIRRI